LPIFDHLFRYVPWPVLRRAAYTVESIISPGFVAHYALRKHAIRAQVRRWVDEGYRQVVLLGAGFDMLSESIPRDVSVFELDLPATQEAKRRALRTVASGSVSFIPIDLAVERLGSALHHSPLFDPDARTVFVAEGLLMYLRPDRAEALLGDMAHCTPDVRVAFTVITPDSSGHYRLHSQRKVVDWCMRWLDEPFVWGVPRDGIEALLDRHGLVLENIVCTTELRDRFLPEGGRRSLPRASGELLMLARGSSTAGAARESWLRNVSDALPAHL
jgi:methyltransferase (TIGR00027 family)